MIYRSVALGCGAALPPKFLTNKDLEEKIETSDEWIRERTGISKRHVADKGILTSDLAVEASLKAIQNSNISPHDIDCIIVGTVTGDIIFPSVANLVQKKLGIRTGFSFDVQAACSGFIYALSVADNFIKSGQINTALVIGAETLTNLIDWKDRTTCVLFGDGAGAVVLKREKGTGSVEDRGVLSTHLYSDGHYSDMLYCNGGVGSTQSVGSVVMNGREVFRNAVEKLTQSVETALEYNKVTSNQIDWLIPHQANYRIIEALAKKLALPMDKIVVTIQDHANTSSASIPLALYRALEDNKIKKGDLLLMDAMGGGFTWASCLIRW